MGDNRYAFVGQADGLIGDFPRMRVLAYIPLALVIITTVGLGILPSPIGALAILALLIVTGLAWRIVQFIAGVLMIVFSQA